MNLAHKLYAALALSCAFQTPYITAASHSLVAGDNAVTFIDSIEANKITIATYNRRGGEVKTLLAETNFDAPLVTRELKNLFRAKKGSDKKFVPESVVGKLFNRICTPLTPYTYSGTPIIDEINKGNALRVILGNENDVKIFITYLKKNESQIKVPATNKPLLYFGCDASLLSADDQNFLRRHFILDSSEETRKFFAESQIEMDEIEKSETEYKTLWEGAYHSVLKYCDDFKVEKITQNLTSKLMPETIQAIAYYLILMKSLGYAKENGLISKDAAKIINRVFVIVGLRSALMGHGKK